MRSLIIAALAILPVVICLRCYSGTGQQNITEVQQTDCILGLSCTKQLDVMTGVFVKQCNSYNCTNPYMPTVNYAPAGCYSANNPGNGHNITTCCCYGDGCNSVSGRFMWPTLIFSAIAGYIGVY